MQLGNALGHSRRVEVWWRGVRLHSHESGNEVEGEGPTDAVCSKSHRHGGGVYAYSRALTGCPLRPRLDICVAAGAKSGGGCLGTKTWVGE